MNNNNLGITLDILDEEIKNCIAFISKVDFTENDIKLLASLKTVRNYINDLYNDSNDINEVVTCEDFDNEWGNFEQFCSENEMSIKDMFRLYSLMTQKSVLYPIIRYFNEIEEEAK